MFASWDGDEVDPPLFIEEVGPAWFAAMGSGRTAGTKVLSIAGDCRRPGIYEVPFGITPAELLVKPTFEYPVVLRNAGIPGRAVVQFVIDTIGRFQLMAGAAHGGV